VDQGDDDAYKKVINVPINGPANEPFVRDTTGSRKDVPAERLSTRTMLISGVGADIANEVCTSKGTNEVGREEQEALSFGLITKSPAF
jgi:hypothetical protein